MRIGQKVMTRGIALKTGTSWIYKRFVEDSLNKFINEDFGVISDEDKQTNIEALENDGMVMGAYILGNVKIWIMREPDGKGSFVTTILFPDEY